MLSANDGPFSKASRVRWTSDEIDRRLTASAGRRQYPGIALHGFPRSAAWMGFRHPQGRAIVATVAWGTACETLGHADEFAGIHPSDLSVARAEVARAEVARTRDVFNEALAGIGLGPFLADDEQ
jgi:hypothetical protein